MKSEEMYKNMTALLDDAKDLYDGVDERITELEHICGIRNANIAVKDLTDKLARPWTEYVTNMGYCIDKYVCSISCDRDTYHWHICNSSNRFDFEGRAKTLQEAARAIASIIVMRRG